MFHLIFPVLMYKNINHPQANSCMPYPQHPTQWNLSSDIYHDGFFAHSRNLHKYMKEYGHNFPPNFFHLEQFLWIGFVRYISCLVLMMNISLLCESATLYLFFWWVIITFNNYRIDSHIGYIQIPSQETLPQKVDTHFFIS